MSELLAEGPPEDQPMTLFEHLEELRKRIMYATLWLAAGTVLAYLFKNEILALIGRPVVQALNDAPHGGKLVNTQVGTLFFTALKASVVFGLFLSGPFVVRELWKFIASGLYAKEKRHVTLFAPISYLLFIAGAVFFYIVVQPVMLRFFIDFASDEPDLLTGQVLPVEPMIDIGQWFTLWLGMLLIMGVIFQLPLLMVIAQLAGLADARTYASYRRHFIVGSVIVAAFLTPTGDAITLSLTMIPVVLLFEVGILFCRVLGRRKTESSSGKETSP